MAIYDKNHNLLWGPYPGNTIWNGFGGPCDSCNDGDPVVLYDQLAGRWVISQFAVASGPPYYQYVAVSQTSDPLGAWYRYSFTWPNNKFNDYPKLGVWPDGYYMTANQFVGNTWSGAGVAVMDRQSMLQGLPATIQYFDLYSVNANYGGMLPSTVDGPAPPAGTPNYFAEVDDSSTIGTVDAMRIWSFHVDWSNPSSTTFGLSGSPNWTLPVAPFTPICPSTRNCISQPDTSRGLDAIGDRLMYRLQYRNFGGYQTLVVNHTVDAGGGVAGIRWYEMRNSGSGWSIYQQGTYAPDSDNRWMASAAMNGEGDIAIGFSVSSSSTYPSIRYAGRRATDPLGVLTQGETTLVSGHYSQTSTYYRWGDYTTLNVDPSDDCTFWYTNEYLKSTSTADWTTQIGSFVMPCCTTPGTPTGLSATVPGDNEIDLAWSAGTPAGDTYSVYRTTGSCPGSGYSLLASGLSSASYSDTTVSGGTTYAYEVTAVDSTGGCESGASGCASGTATGACTAPPTFAGLSSVTNPASATCELDLAWSAATPNCGSSVYYNVYRSTSSSFVPSASNWIATGVVGTTYADNAGLTFNVPYYYVVRAVDVSNGVEDANSVAISGTPLGPVTDGTFAAGAESGDPAMYTGGSSGQWYLTTSMAHSGTSSYWSGYNNSECSYLVTPSLALTASKNSTLTYWTAWNIEDRYDGGVVEISTDGGATWTRLTPSPGYPGNIQATSDACGYATNTPRHSGTNSSYMTFAQYSVDLSAYNGSTVYIRWDLSTDYSVTGQGWFVDDVSITHVQTQGTCTTGASPGSVKPVPDGKWVSGTPMQASKAAADGSTVDLTWDVGTCQDANYNLYYGNGSDVSTYALQGSDCGLGNSGTASGVTLPAVPSGQTFIWWVIAGTDGVQTESSWGRDSTGNERHPAASNQCGMTAKSTATSCP